MRLVGFCFRTLLPYSDSVLPIWILIHRNLILFYKYYIFLIGPSRPGIRPSFSGETEIPGSPNGLAFRRTRAHTPQIGMVGAYSASRHLATISPKTMMINPHVSAGRNCDPLSPRNRNFAGCAESAEISPKTRPYTEDAASREGPAAPADG